VRDSRDPRNDWRWLEVDKHVGPLADYDGFVVSKTEPPR